MTLEDRFETTFGGTRFCGGLKIDQAGQRQNVLVLAPVLARLSREGTVALGDVFSHCIALAGLPLAGRPPERLGILVLDANGGTHAVVCMMQKKGIHAEGARRLEAVGRALARVGSVEALEAMYRKACSKGHKTERLADVALSHWSESSPAIVPRTMDGWAESLSTRRTALYLAMDRKPGDRPSLPMDPITPMQKLLESRSGGIFQVLSGATKTKPQNRFLGDLEEPARIIWAYRRLMTA